MTLSLAAGRASRSAVQRKRKVKERLGGGFPPYAKRGLRPWHHTPGGVLVSRNVVMKAWSVIGPLFAAAILATIPKNGPGDDMPAPGRNYLRAPSAPELRVPLWC